MENKEKGRNKKITKENQRVRSEIKVARRTKEKNGNGFSLSEFKAREKKGKNAGRRRGRKLGIREKRKKASERKK